MNAELLGKLRCPNTGQRLLFEKNVSGSQPDYEGWLVSEDKTRRYPIKNGIPRFVPQSNYADNFGMQWNYFKKTQLDSHSGHPISADRFWSATGWDKNQMNGKWVLDVGCGSGRFAEIALTSGAKVVALDYSTAVDACMENLGKHPNLHVFQGDIYALPFEAKSFDYIYSLGVLQHTPDVATAFFSLPPKLVEGGKLCVDFYWKRFRTVLHAKYLVRPITKRMSQRTLFDTLRITVPILLSLSNALGRIPLVGRAFKRLIPVANYTGVYPLSDQQLLEWATLDTFDMLSPRYDTPQTARTAEQWLRKGGFVDIAVFHCCLLVARGTKKKAQA